MFARSSSTVVTRSVSGFVNRVERRLITRQQEYLVSGRAGIHFYVE